MCDNEGHLLSGIKPIATWLDGATLNEDKEA